MTQLTELQSERKQRICIKELLSHSLHCIFSFYVQTNLEILADVNRQL